MAGSWFDVVNEDGSLKDVGELNHLGPEDWYDFAKDAVALLEDLAGSPSADVIHSVLKGMQNSESEKDIEQLRLKLTGSKPEISPEPKKNPWAGDVARTYGLNPSKFVTISEYPDYLINCYGAIQRKGEVGEVYPILSTIVDGTTAVYLWSRDGRYECRSVGHLLRIAKSSTNLLKG